MCGIFGYIGKRNSAPEIVLQGIKTLEYRGYDSWGIAVQNLESRIQNNKQTLQHIEIKKRIGKIGEANVDDMPPSSLSIGHTRWATHGGVTEKNSHPHLDCAGSIAIIHNGIIENYETLKKSLQRKGVKLTHPAGGIGRHIFSSETDSEVAAHMIEILMEKNRFTEAVRKTFMQFEGSNALIAINAKERIIVAVRNGSPLVVGYGDGEYFIASDAAALLPYTKRVYFMKDYDMAELTDTGIKITDSRNRKTKNITPQTLTWNTEDAKKGSYESFMQKEIHQQPEVIERIARQKDKNLILLSQKIKSSYGTYLIGCGTASYACLAGTYLFSTIAKRHINTAIASEFSYHLDFLTKKSLVVALSQSGETMDLITSIEKAKQKGATIASLINVMGSTLFRMSDISIPTLAGPEIGVASTKDMISKLCFLILLSYGVADQWEKGRTLLVKTAHATKKVLSGTSIKRIHTLAQKIKKSRTIFVVGRGLSYPTALEVALKIKEISYIHAEGLPAGELKHGPIALIEKRTPCIVFLPNDETYGANLAAAMEMKARGGLIIGVSYTPHDVFDEFLPVSDVGVATIIPNIVTGQILSYSLTKLRGFDPDKPKNLAKSVTVK